MSWAADAGSSAALFTNPTRLNPEPGRATNRPSGRPVYGESLRYGPEPLDHLTTMFVSTTALAAFEIWDRRICFTAASSVGSRR